MVELHLPYPVSVNRIWSRTKRGMCKSDSYSAWIEDAREAALKQKRGRIIGPYKLSIGAVRPDKRKRDIDNLIKGVSDFLQYMGIIENDCDCEMVSARWVTSGHGVTVRVERAVTECGELL